MHTFTSIKCTQHGSTGKPNILWDQFGKFVGTVETVGNAEATDAYAARIVACVNACAGIRDPQLMRTALGEAVRYVYEKMPMGEDREALRAILLRADNH